jgi:hypothetical protein
VVIWNKAARKAELDKYLRKDHIVIDLVNLEKACRSNSTDSYEGICW